MGKNSQLEDFRADMEMILDQHAEKMRLFIKRNPNPKFLKAVIDDPLSKWSLDWDALNKKMKKAVAGLINKIHIEAYSRDLK